MESSRFDSCPCCLLHSFSCTYENHNVKEVLDWKDFFYGSSAHVRDLHECKYCKYRFINTIELYYERHYINQLTDDNQSLDNFRYSYFKKMKLRLIKKYPKFKKKGTRILDVGCARGLWLDQWTENSELYGSEYSTEHKKTLKNKNIRVVSEDDITVSSFDIISLFDVLEHIEDPFDYLDKLYGSLAPGGVLIVAVPDMGKILAKVLKQNYYLICPMHFSYFTRESLSKLFLRLFKKENIHIEKSPVMHTDIQGVSRWISIMPKVAGFLNFSIPVPYRASLVIFAQKPIHEIGDK
jgi:2-polyprenyl-3-methyl-5-hydroxy-6-metoxy-1,4-benzoquinol methylase